MFGEYLFEAAANATQRPQPVSAAARASNLSSRSRSEGNPEGAGKAGEASAGLNRSRSEPVAAKDRSAEARKGKRGRTDGTEDEAPRPRVKFRPPKEGEPVHPIFEEEGREVPRPAEPLLEEIPGDSEVESERHLGQHVDVYA